MADFESLINNEELSDVSFMIGDDKKIFHANKAILASGSDVFKTQFYGSLAEKLMPIVVPDLTSKGFNIMIKYLYTKKFVIELSDIYEVLTVAEKYLIENLIKEILKFVEQNLNESNICLIYDQLINFNRSELLEQVRKLFMSKSKKAFQNEYFKEIKYDTLIDILNLETLTIDEVNILSYCLIWIENKLSKNNEQPTIENKRKLFKSIKNLIRFEDIDDPNSLIKGVNELDSLLENDEISELCLYLVNRTRSLPIKCKTLRKKNLRVFENSAIFKMKMLKNFGNINGQFISEINVKLNVNHNILIKSVRPIFSKFGNFRLSILDKDDVLLHKATMINENSYNLFKFGNGVVIKPILLYKFSFEINDAFPGESYFSDQRLLKVNLDNKQVIFYIDYSTIFHCISEIEFPII